MIGSRPVSIAFTVAILASIAAVFVVPRPVQWLAVVIVFALIASNLARVFWTFRDGRRRADAVITAHPGETALGTGLLAYDGISASDRARVVAVIAGRDGLSFRDGSDVEVAQVAASRILSIELAPLERRRPRPAVVTLADGAPVRFYVGAVPDQQAEAIVALRTALGRS